jgi:NTE family protein
MPKVAKPKDIAYLALEGGGGKGVTYLGAIIALEEMGVLPINKPAGKNQIKGIAGASAGAITALLLALGYDSKRIKKLLSNSAQFNKFFDPPDPGSYRAVDRTMRPVIRNDSPDLKGAELLRFIEERRKKIDVLEMIQETVAKFGTVGGGIAGGPGGAIAGGLGAFVLVGVIGLLANAKVNGFFEEHQDDPILAALGKNVGAYVYNLVYDRGLFPGFAVRRFFQSILIDYIGQRVTREGGGLAETGQIAGTLAGTLSFEQLYRATGVDLMFTGANVTQNRMYYFSKRDTPEFPVIEAVAISMNLPFLFKPVYLETDMPVSKRNPKADGYHGYWVDGGLLNNLPLHAFDDAPDNPRKSEDPDLRPLHPGVLALRLTDGFESPEENLEATSKVAGTFDALFAHLAGIMGAILAPSEEGQLRTPAERDQTIDLYTDALATTEFAPSDEKSRGPIANARRKIYEYFLGTGMQGVFR